jgi:N6-adenosine-specific RNA methylase IME4
MNKPSAQYSAKPEIFLKMIESYCQSLPKIELNRREPARDGWDAWGGRRASREAV